MFSSKVPLLVGSTINQRPSGVIELNIALANSSGEVISWTQSKVAMKAKLLSSGNL